MGKKKVASSVPTTSSLWEADTPTSRATTDIEDDDDDGTSVILELTEKDSTEVIDERSDLEKQLYTCVKKGDRKGLRELVSTAQESIDISHKDLHGHDILTHAVEAGQNKMINLVLSIDASVDIKEALLHAIKDNKMDMVLKLLYFEDTRSGGAFYATTKRLLTTSSSNKKKGGGSGKDKPAYNFDQSEYGHEITPLMMAAQNGHYELMQVLYNRGERLPQLHLPSCACSVCKFASRDLKRTAARISLLKALTNPTYMIFMAGQDGSYDPVLEALGLCETLKTCADEEPEFKKEYDDLKKNVKKLPVELLGRCRTVEETKLFMVQKQGYEGPRSTPFPRLALAIEQDHKNFVAHPNVQFLLQNEYYGPVWKSAKTDLDRTLKIMVAVAAMVFFPLVQLYLWFALICCSSMPAVRYLLSPHLRSMSKLGSYIYFCAALFYMNIEERAEADIEPPTIYVRWIVVLYVLSLLVTIVRRFMIHPGDFFRNNWNLFDCFTQACFWFSFAIWVYLFMRKSELGYEETLPRRRMPSDDPLLLEECAFAIASTFATCRLLRWFILSPVLGPFQASLYSMIEQVGITFIFVVWIVATFTVSSTMIFRPYKNLTKYDEDKSKEVHQNMDLTEVQTMFTNYFLNGKLSEDVVEIYPVNRTFINAEGKPEVVENVHETTQWFATVFLVIYNVIVMSFLKDAMVGLFGATGEEVGLAKDAVWKNDRAKEFLYYIQEGHLAPPFNLIPNAACLSNLCRWMSAVTCRKGGEVEAGCNFGECCYLRDVEDPVEMEEQQRQYPFLMRNLFQRYFKDKAREEKEPTKKIVDKVQTKVKETRGLFEQMTGKSKSALGLGPQADSTGLWFLMNAKDKSKQPLNK